MKITKNKFMVILIYFMCLSLAMQGVATAKTVVAFSSAMIIVKAKVTTHPDEYNTYLSTNQMTSPVVGDLDSDGILEIICAGYNDATKKSKIFVWERKGLLRNGWPVEVDGKVEYAPAIGDLDGDGNLEIVVTVTNVAPAGGGKVYVWRHDGSIYNDEYPEIVNGYIPGAPVFGDVQNGFADEYLYSSADTGIALCDMDSDGKKEVLVASPGGLSVLKAGDPAPEPWSTPIFPVGTPVAGDVDGDGKPEVFLAVHTPDANYIFGWKNDKTKIPGWEPIPGWGPKNIDEVVNAPGNFLSIADINGDGIAEIVSGSKNGWIKAWRFDGTEVFSQKPQISEDKALTNEIYQPIIADINNDNNMEILATSKYGNIYCYDSNGNPITVSPPINYELAPGAVLVDIDMDSQGDVLNPPNDLELLFSASDGQVHSIDLPGDFDTNKIQWGMYGYNSRQSNNYLRDWDTLGWSIFDNDPTGATINSIYDWNRGGRVIELKGMGVNNCYVFKKADGNFLNSKDTKLQWSMRFDLPFNIYVSVNTLKGIKYLHYTATEGNQLADPTGVYIHHGLGTSANNSKWHTFSRELVQDLKDADASNGIISVNAIYIQGSGRVDDVMLLPGLSAVNLNISASSGLDTIQFINDGNPNTKWVSGNQLNPSVTYIFENPQTINKIFLEGVTGATSGSVYVILNSGVPYPVRFDFDITGAEPFEVLLDTINDVKSIVVVFNNTGGHVEVGELNAYYDGTIEEEEFTTADYIEIKDGYFFNPVTNNYWIPHGAAYLTWNDIRGQNQTPVELGKDLDMMKEAGVNAIRVDFAWKNIETEDNIWNSDVSVWSNYDSLLEKAKARGIKVFPIIGSQVPPSWFNAEWRSMHPKDSNHTARWQSNVISYENSFAVEQLIDFIYAVVLRYSIGGEREDLASVIAAWIIGNQFDYINPTENIFEGYDDESVKAYREWLENKYPGEDFSEIDMPISDTESGWADLTEWRKESIANFAEKLAEAVKDTETAIDNNKQHLITYASLSMQEEEKEWSNSSEDAGKISQACNGLLDFWCINNYPLKINNDEIVAARSLVEVEKLIVGLPVMVTEVGFSSTEVYPGITESRQAKLDRNAVWNALESGAIGVCLFHWNDRDAAQLAQREKGFGIVDINRNPKLAYNEIKKAFEKMDSIKFNELLPQFNKPIEDMEIGGSKYVLAYYSAKNDSSEVLLSLNNYNKDIAQPIQLSSNILAGKEIKDLVSNQVISDDSSDSIISQDIEADGHSLILAYTTEPGNKGLEAKTITDQEIKDEVQDDKNKEVITPSDDTGTADLPKDAKQPPVPQSTGGPAPDSIGNEEQQQQTYYTGPAIVIAGVGAKEEEEITNEKIPQSQKSSADQGTGRKAGVRTYTGMVITGGSSQSASGQQQIDEFTSAAVSNQTYQQTEQQVIKEYPALEQFRMAMTANNRRGEVGVIKAQPVTVTPERLKQMMQLPMLQIQTKAKIQVPAFDIIKLLNSWINKAKGWAKNLAKNIYKLAKTKI